MHGARWSLGLAALLLAAGAIPGPPDAHARPATGGSGRLHDAIDWFEWGTHLQTISGAAQTRTNTIAAGGATLAVTCSLSGFVGIALAYRPGAFAGAGSTTSTTSAGSRRRTR